MSDFFINTVADASASWPWDGMTEGGDENLGSYYSCLEMDSKMGGSAAPFLGQYCLVRHYIPLADFPVGPPSDSELMPGVFEYGSRGVLKPLYSNKTFSSSFAQVRHINTYQYHLPV